LGPFPDGKVEILKAKPKFPWEYSKVNEFVSRQYDLYKLICCISQNRLTTLKGIPGIGKTAISKNLGSLLAEREVFQDGIIYLSMQGHDLVSQFVKMMYYKLINERERKKHR